MNLKKSDGLLLYDISSIISNYLWKVVENGMLAGGMARQN